MVKLAVGIAGAIATAWSSVTGTATAGTVKARRGLTSPHHVVFVGQSKRVLANTNSDPFASKRHDVNETLHRVGAANVS